MEMWALPARHPLLLASFILTEKCWSPALVDCPGWAGFLDQVMSMY